MIFSRLVAWLLRRRTPTAPQWTRLRTRLPDGELLVRDLAVTEDEWLSPPKRSHEKPWLSRRSD